MEENLLEIESKPAVYSVAGRLPGLFTADEDEMEQRRPVLARKSRLQTALSVLQ
jgi:hypothetical protein